MIKSDKKLTSLSQLLKKDNKAAISRAIETLRNEEPFEGAIELLAAFYDRTDDETLKKSVELFMNDLKDPSSRQEVIEAIRKHTAENTAAMLVSSCWQSGLDYSGYSEDFVKIFISAGYVTAIECLTVITESVPQLSRERKDKLIEILENSPAELPEKSALTGELRSVLLG